MAKKLTVKDVIPEIFVDTEEHKSLVTSKKKESETCVYPGCERKPNEKYLFVCAGHPYRLPYELRSQVKTQTADQSEIEEYFKEIKKNEVMPEYILGQGEPEVELTLNQAKILVLIENGADICNKAIAADLRRMEMTIPRSKKLFEITKSKRGKTPINHQAQGDDPVFGAKSTALGVEIAKKHLEKVNPKEIQLSGIEPY